MSKFSIDELKVLSDALEYAINDWNDCINDPASPIDDKVRCASGLKIANNLYDRVTASILRHEIGFESSFEF